MKPDNAEYRIKTEFASKKAFLSKKSVILTLFPVDT